MKNRARQMLRSIRGCRSDERGAALLVAAGSMVALLSAVALAVDVGMLMAARAEAQTTADAAALAGAGVLRDTNGDSAQAHTSAMNWLAKNTVRGEIVTVLEEDVEVIPEEWTVRVQVQRTEARGASVPTFFAAIFGVHNVDITAAASAWAAPASTSGGDGHCMLPLALIDKFDDLDGDGEYDPGSETLTGYDESDHGKLIKLKLRPAGPGSGPPMCQTDTNPDSEVEYNIDYCASSSSSWRCWWRPDHPSQGGGGGVDVLGPLIYPAETCEEEVGIGDLIWAASGSGNKQSLVNTEFEELIRADQDKEWCPDCATGGSGCLVDANDPTTCFEGESVRRRTIPVVDPSVAGGGANTISEVTDFMGVFVEQVSCSYSAGEFGGPDGLWNVYVRLMVEGGSGATGGTGSSEESLVRNLQLIR